MTLSGFLSKLNWRLMLVHLVAYWFLWEAVECFAVLYDYHFIVNFYQHHHFSKPITNAEFRSISKDDYKRLLYYRTIVAMLPLSSLILALVLSLIISIKKKWYWLNAVIVFLVVIALVVIWGLNKIHITPWTYLQYIFDTPGYFFKGSIWYVIINGAVLLVIGLSLFFLEPVNRFIETKKELIKPIDADGQAAADEPTA